MSKSLEALLEKKKKYGSTREKRQWKGVAVTMTEEEREILEQYAREHYKFFGGLVREITLKYIQKQEEELNQEKRKR
ncbi:hypothetical protein HpCK38_19600 [Helicobacter pylori]